MWHKSLNMQRALPRLRASLLCNTACSSPPCLDLFLLLLYCLYLQHQFIHSCAAQLDWVCVLSFCGSDQSTTIAWAQTHYSVQSDSQEEATRLLTHNKQVPHQCFSEPSFTPVKYHKWLWNQKAIKSMFLWMTSWMPPANQYMATIPCICCSQKWATHLE